MSIVALHVIDSEARDAAAKFKTPNEACRFPFDSAAGRRWNRVYTEERERLSFEYARKAYAEAIAEATCIN